MGAGKVHNKDFDLYVNPYPKAKVITVASLSAGDKVDLVALMGRKVTGIMTNANNGAGSMVSLGFRDDPDLFVPVRLARGIVYPYDILYLDATTVPNADIVIFS